jgi:hypothetical protein
MTVTHKRSEKDELAAAPLFTAEAEHLSKNRIADTEMAPDVAYQIIHDELMLDGNARMNLATFVTTWMEPQAEKLMAECLDKNMIDKDEYPQTAELEMRCVKTLSRLWHAPDAGQATGCSTTGSSEAAMLGGLALKRRWYKRRAAAGEPTDKPNLVMGINVQVCWEKLANYWDVERLKRSPSIGTSRILRRGGGQALRREHEARPLLELVERLADLLHRRVRAVESRAQDRHDPDARSSTSRTPSASAAGRCLPTPSPRTAPISPPCAWW